MSEPYVSEIRMFSFGFAPKGWFLCNGQILQISQYQALFSLLGTSYGGDGVRTFALPDLRGRIPLHFHPAGPLGESAGELAHLLSAGEIPAHSHPLMGSSLGPGQPGAVNGMWPTGGTLTPYADTTDGSVMAGAAVGLAGGGQPHPNLPPYLTVSFAIAYVGIFPSRN